MKDQELQTAFLRGWLLVLVSMILSLAFFFLAVGTNVFETPPRWDMDGKPFVPASSPYADGYPLPYEHTGLSIAEEVP